MSKQRPKHQPGRHLPAMDHSCGFDGGNNDANICGSPATFHLYAGDPAVGPSDWAMTACPEHFPAAQELAFDWHEIQPICDVPGTMWMARNEQGEGFCYWPEAEQMQAEQLATIEVAA